MTQLARCGAALVILAWVCAGAQAQSRGGGRDGSPRAATPGMPHAAGRSGRVTTPSPPTRVAIRSAPATGALSRTAGRGVRFGKERFGVGALGWNPLWWPLPPIPEPEFERPEPTQNLASAPAPPPPPPGPSSIQPLPRPQPPARSAASGTLRLDVIPPDAHVYVDGFYVGSADALDKAGGLSLDPGWHRLEFRAPGYLTPAVNVTIEANGSTTCRLALQPAGP